ncbi:MAG: ferrichrome ABC transporter permease [Verrucomicrobia bacterium]|nr:ferrichrome ABC transporter permease [Verrucomicrobiota bacterium]
MRLIILTVFLSSFLLFQVQPLIGKYILPWFGGIPAVWTACMLFFQATLLAGYAYAHFIVNRFNISKQVFIHAFALIVTFIWLPMAPPDWVKPDDASWPVMRVLLVLLVSVGGPFLLVSATAPLLQSWFSQAFPGRSPYRLYALSNTGSLLGLFAYPFVIERLLTLSAQTWVWSAAYLLFAFICISTGWRVWRRVESANGESGEVSGAGKQNSDEGPASSAGSKVLVVDVFFWLALSACGSVMLLATTNQLCQNVASVPFLWVVPLGLYLVTFILCFEGDGWYRRGLFGMLWPAALAAAIWLDLGAFVSVSLQAQIAMYCFVLFVCCMVCHGELARLRPNPDRLTLFFFVMSVGGLLGGIFVTLIAPLVFNLFYEFYIGLIGSGVALIAVLRRGHWQTLNGVALKRSIAGTVLTAFAMIALVFGASWIKTQMISQAEEVIAVHRDFYGIVKVVRQEGFEAGDTLLAFTNGNTTHGFQFESEEKRTEPVCYYERSSGVGKAIEYHPRQRKGEALRVGLIGLGVGTLAAYAKEGDEYEFYEINPEVERIAREHFTYLKDAEQRGAKITVNLGDARLALERRLELGEPDRYDVLVVDAFNSDTVPVHLLTEEAFVLYQRYLKADGILAIHISNRYLDLVPVVRSSLAGIKIDAVQILHVSTDLDILPKDTPIESHWILATGDRKFLTQAEIVRAHSPWDDSKETIRWTDQYSSLFRALRVTQ